MVVTLFEKTNPILKGQIGVRLYMRAYYEEKPHFYLVKNKAKQSQFTGLRLEIRNTKLRIINPELFQKGYLKKQSQFWKG